MRECHRVQLKITYFFPWAWKNKRLSSSESVSPNCYYSYLKTSPLTFWSTSTWAELSKGVRELGIWNFPVHSMWTKQKSPRAALVSLSLTLKVKLQKTKKAKPPFSLQPIPRTNHRRSMLLALSQDTDVFSLKKYLPTSQQPAQHQAWSPPS